MIGLSEFTQNYGLFIAGFILLLIVVLLGLLRDPERKRRWHAMMLNLPWLGRWTKMANIADWSRSLGVLLGNGVRALAALKISSTVVSNLYLRGKMDQVTEYASRQYSAKSLEEQNIGSGFLIHMVGSGEASSELDKMLMRVSDYYSLRLANAVEVFLKLINPILIVFMRWLFYRWWQR